MALPPLALLALTLPLVTLEHADSRFQNFRVNPSDNTFTVASDSDDVILSGTFSAAGAWESCSSTSGGLCIDWPGAVTLAIASRDIGFDDARCVAVEWRASSATQRPRMCFHLAGSHWYGGAEMYHQRWPIEQQSAHLQPYYSNDYLVHPDDITHAQFGPILEPYWITSRGVGIHVGDHVALHVSLNDTSDGDLCLEANARGFWTHDAGSHVPTLACTVCVAPDVRAVHAAMAARVFARPEGLPDERMVRSPVWSTWARYKTAVNQSAVLQYAGEILQHGFPNSQLEIDDMYTTAYGDLTFDSRKFPFPLDMCQELKRLGFRITAWVTPYANLDSLAFLEGAEKGYWMKDSRGEVPGLVRWWQGVGGILDPTNPDAVRWYVGRLEQLRRSVGLDSFKFDSGEVGYLPERARCSVPLDNANQYTTRYAAVVAQLGRQVEMRAAYGTQRHPFFLRMMDKDSRWGYDNGLKTMIPTALTLSLLGYNYILPDMIGGNAYDPADPLHRTVLPERELFIRWVQLSAFLPAMQFSVAPWQYDPEVVAIARDMVRVHEEVVTPVVIRAYEEALVSGDPVIRPLWWLDPRDEDSLEIDSQFLVADELLVAPILDEGARFRDIYIPRGTWEDETLRESHVGPRWLRGYGVDLDQIATFRRMK